MNMSNQEIYDPLAMRHSRQLHGPKNKPFAVGSLVRVRSGIYTLSDRVGVVVGVIEDFVYPDEYEVLVMGQSMAHWFDYDEIECAISGRGDQ